VQHPGRESLTYWSGYGRGPTVLPSDLLPTCSRTAPIGHDGRGIRNEDGSRREARALFYWILKFGAIGPVLKL